MPFVSMSNTNRGDYRICCESFEFGPSIQLDDATIIWNGEFYKKIRLDLVNGVKHPNCSACWRVDEFNGYSTRQNETAKYTQTQIESILDNLQEDGTLTLMPTLFDLKLGNLCNLKCITCCQLSSSLHETEVKLWQAQDVKLPGLIEFIEIKFKDQNQQYRLDRDNFVAIFNNLKSVLGTITNLRLVGGEPLINPFTHFIINNLDDYSKNIELEIITNVTEIDKDLVSKFKNFKSVRVTCSIDHIDATKFNYIRYPADYTQCRENFEYLQTLDIILEISLTLSIFNIFDFEAILTEFDKFNLDAISFNFASDPDYFSIKYLEPEQKRDLIRRVGLFFNQPLAILKNKNLANYLRSTTNFLNSQQDNFSDVVKERTRVLRLYDKTRKTNYKELFPFIKDYE